MPNIDSFVMSLGKLIFIYRVHFSAGSLLASTTQISLNVSCVTKSYTNWEPETKHFRMMMKTQRNFRGLGRLS